MTTLRFSALSHVGRVRSVNEDSLISMPDRRIWAVADGMGGHEAGDFASQTVVEQIAAIPGGLSPSDTMQELKSAILRAHRAIRAESRQRGGKVVGATVVALFLVDGHFVAFWAGDSRVYRLRNGTLEMLTTDHSAVAELVEAGLLTWDQAERHPQSNAITRAVGVGEDLELDKVRGDVLRGDRFLLCSDGLTKYADSTALRRLLADTPLATVCDRLVQWALDGGGGDNVSAIVIDVA